MMRRWVGAAVIAGCLGLAPAARAQVNPPPACPGPLPEPVPFCPESGPNLVPGPLAPSNAPPGPSADLSLPNDGTGAFPCKECEPECAPYFHIGAEMLQRQHLASGTPLGLQDPGNLDTGAVPPNGQPAVQSLSELHPRIGAGPRATLGYVFDGNQAVELTAFYVFENNAVAAVTKPGQIDAFFSNPPLGFEGDNGLWLQADRMRTTLATTVWGAELNYHYTDQAVTGAELIAGVRYFDLKERLSNYTDDDGVQFPLTNGLPDPTRVATYSVQTRNQLVAPQLGFEREWNPCCYLDLGFGAKGAWGANHVALDRGLVRGDGFLGFVGHRSEWQFSQMYELNAFVDFHLLERARIRLGYNAMWFANMANAVDQLDFNLQDTNSLLNRNGSVFLFGPTAELQFLF